MPVIEGRELALPQSLDDCNDGGVDEPESQVGVTGEELADPDVVGSRDVYDLDRAVLEVGEERCKRLGAETGAGKPVELYNHGSRHHQRLTETGKQVRAGSMVGVGPVHCCVERSGVTDQRHERGS